MLKLVPCAGAVAALALCGCGSLVGNSGPSSGGTQSSFLKTIDYAIPTSVSGYSLADGDALFGPPPDGIFQDSMNRFVGVIDRINALTGQLNATVTAEGTYHAAGPDQKVDVVVTAQTGGTYDFQATFCESGKAFQFMEWSSVSGRVHAVRSYGVDPVDASRVRDMTSDVTYVPGDTATLRQLSYQTPPPGKAPPGENGVNLGEIITSTRTSASTYTMSGVHNWVNDPSELDAEGDEYFIGKFDANGSGETVGYNVARKTDCDAVFDETKNNWCTGKDLAGNTYTGAAITAAAARLKGIAVESKANIIKPALPTGLTCP